MDNKYEYIPLFPPMEYSDCLEKIRKMDRVCDICGSNLRPAYIQEIDKYKPACFSHSEMNGHEISSFTNGVSKENYNLAFSLVTDFSSSFDYINHNKKKFETLFNEAIIKNCLILNNIEEIKRLGKKRTKEEFKYNIIKYHHIEE